MLSIDGKEVEEELLELLGFIIIRIDEVQAAERKERRWVDQERRLTGSFPL